MALRKWDKNGVRLLTDREIKKEIMNRLGLDPKSAVDQKYYKKQYDLQRLRTVNFSKQQNLETAIRPNENWLSTLRRQQEGIDLTAQQLGILRTSTQNTAKYAARVELGDARITAAGISNLEYQFSEMLNKVTGFKEAYNKFRTKEVSTVAQVDEYGEIVKIYNLTNGESPPAILPKGNVLEDIITERVERTDQSITDVKEYLEGLADELHTWQDERMSGNRAFFGKSTRAKRKAAGSP